MSTPVVVYIARTEAGELLYVGVTGNLKQRMASHKSRSAWWSPTVRLTTEEFARWPEAERREAELIETLRPPFNPPRSVVLAVSGELRKRVERLAERRGIKAKELLAEIVTREMDRLEGTA